MQLNLFVCMFNVNSGHCSGVLITSNSDCMVFCMSMIIIIIHSEIFLVYFCLS